MRTLRRHIFIVVCQILQSSFESTIIDGINRFLWSLKQINIICPIHDWKIANKWIMFCMFSLQKFQSDWTSSTSQFFSHGQYLGEIQDMCARYRESPNGGPPASIFFCVLCTKGQTCRHAHQVEYQQNEKLFFSSASSSTLYPCQRVSN